MNLTDEQKDLLRLLVSKHQSNGRQPFIFVRSMTAAGLCYHGSDSVPVANDDLDFHQLRRENLITFISVAPNQWRGKPTERGIAAVRDIVSADEPAQRADAPDKMANLVSVPTPAIEAMAHVLSWQEIQAEFQKYVEAYDDLSAEYDSLDPGQWTLRGGSPRAQRLFMEIAAKAATRRELPRAKGRAEPWQLWLGYMHAAGWRGPDTRKSSQDGNPTRRRPSGRPFAVLRKIAEEGERILSRVFQTSADCCQDLAEREESRATVMDTPTAPSGAAPIVDGTNGVSNDVTPPAETTMESKENAGEDRRAAVDAYIAEVFQKTGKRLTRTDIWKFFGYKSRTEFERWERNDPNRPNKTANERFTKMLTQKPHLK